jgi:hypothetical protein
MVLSQWGADGIEYGVLGRAEESAGGQFMWVSHEVLSLCLFFKGELVVMRWDRGVGQ